MACGSGGEQNEQGSTDSTEVVGQSTEEDYDQMQKVELSDFGLMASIYLPQENKGPLMVEESSYGTIVMKVGERFGLEIVPFGMDIVEKRNELEQGTVFQIEVLEERQEYMLYRKFIPGSEVLEEFHIYLTKEIDGELVAVKTLDDMELKEAQAREVLKSAKSLKALAES
jgi:hypothetical protein